MKNQLSIKLIFKFCVGILLLIFPKLFYAQIEVEPTGVLFTPESLISNVFLGEGVQVTNITYDGDDLAVGYFSNGLNDVGIDRGIIMSSGFATTAATANSSTGSSGNTTGGSVCPDLAAIAAPSGLNDVARYTISFIPTADTLRFKYVFASEEYPEYACTGFNDVFGFFLTGPNPAGGNYVGENIALIPDLADPTGLTFTDWPVAINNVNPGVPGSAGGTVANCTPPNGTLEFSAYYNDNSGSTTLTYDGYLNVFIAQAVVTPCIEYTIKLAVADAGDSVYDTGVFLEAKSFGTGSLEVELATLSLDGTVTEDCATASVTFSLPGIVEADFPIDYTIIGTAINGTDYDTIPLDLSIIQGDSSVTIPIIAHEDGLLEGIETIGIDVQLDPCNRDTFWLYIRDNEIVPPDLGEDTTICRTETVQLDGTLPIPLPDPPTFTNDTNMGIVLIDNNNPPPPGTLPTISEIEVFGVQPVELTDGVIKRICINIDHSWISDVDVFLVGPNGQFIELTTDNGGSGDDYIETCFTPVATNPIDFGSQAPPSEAPFTNDWAPEGNWEDLWSIQDPLTNGTWTLQIKDDTPGFNGVLLDWSICFNPLYQIDYSWAPSAGLSCDKCPVPIATPDTTTTYVLTATDTYGCEVYDSITISVLDILPAPDVSCTLITDNSIEFCWPGIPGSLGYEVNVNGNGWIPSNGGLCHNVTGLTLEDTVTILVYGISNCNGEIDTVICWTPACTPPSASVDSFTDASCSDSSDGTATISAIGTYPPFEYTIAGNDTNFTGEFSNLAPGNYTVLIIDDVGCPQNVLLTIGAPPPILTNEILITNASCNGGADGSATVTVTGGTMPYSFNWSTLDTDSIITGLVVDDYYVTVTDMNGCSTIDTVSVTQPPVMSLTLESDSVSCNGTVDGAVMVTVLGGVGPYNYLWDDPGASTTSMVTDLNGGIYTVLVTDMNGCTESMSVEVIENSAIVLAIGGSDVDCNGGNDGSATVIAIGGSGNYTYLWDDINAQTTPVVIGLEANIYNVIITDSDGCTATTSFTINEPAAITLNYLDVPTLCFGDANGQISIISTGGTYPYSYAWSDTPGVIDSTRIDLLAGDYTISVTDVLGCEETIDVTVLEPPELSLALSLNNVTCFGGNDGTTTANISGGTGPYSFLWDANANNQTSQTAIDLLAGSYTVTVTDGNGCTITGTAAVNEPTELQLSITNEDIACFGNNTGTADLEINGGTLPYQSINWVGPNSFMSSSEDITDLYTGTYDVVVTDANGCVATNSVVIDQPSTGIMSSISQPDTICNASASGTANVTVNGGTGPYTYDWSNSETSPLITNLSDGTYYVTITDSGNCTFVDTAYIVETEVISISLSQVGALCHDGNEGSATIDAIFEGGSNVPLLNYTYLWSPSGQNTVTASDLTGGQIYTVTVTDFRGCTATESITIGNPVEIGSRIDAFTNVSCFEGSDGSATAFGEGGTAPYSFLWDVNAGSQITETATDLSSGNYTVIVTDANGCSTINTVDIGQPTILELDFYPEDVACSGSENGSILSVASGGTPGYSYSWSTNSSSNSLDSLPAGTYVLTVTDGNGCTIESQTEINEPEQLDATVESQDVNCFGGREGSLTFFPFGGTPPYTYSLDGTVYSGSDVQLGLYAGEYSAYIQDANGCTAFVGQYTITEPDLLTVELGDNLLIEYGQNVQLNPTITGAQGNVEYAWSVEDALTLSCLDCARPFADPTYTTNYELIITDENGCTAEDMIMIVVEKERDAYVPTGFSPNNDNINDLLVVHGKDIEKVLIFRIYDRWGELVYEDTDFDANDDSRGWDGTYNGQKMNPGVFIWYTEVEFIDASVEVFKGNTTLLR